MRFGQIRPLQISARPGSVNPSRRCDGPRSILGGDRVCYHRNVSLEEKIRRHARALGFPLCGFTRLSRLPRTAFFRDWLARGLAGQMHYLAKQPERRLDPQIPFPEARSVICLGYPYAPPVLPRIDWQAELRGRIAAYAAGADYHAVIQEKLARLVTFLNEQRPGVWARAYVDTGPLLEREWAFRSGLGWFGKNTMLLHKAMGSWFFLAEVLVGLELEGDGVPGAHCGTCTRCMADCPTNALADGYVLESPRCISYLTIEQRGAIPHELRPKMGNWIFGCDVCQEVCPWNMKFGQPRMDLMDELYPSLPALLALDAAGFRARFRRSAVWRTKRRGLLRNVAVALGNSRNPAAVGPLRAALDDPEPLVRGHAAWALGRLGQPGPLKARLDREENASVRQEILIALGERPAPDEPSCRA